MTVQTFKALILFGNPGAGLPLRLDLERRAIEAAIDRGHVDRSDVVFVHATTERDLIARLREAEYDLIQLSGHGTPGEFLLNDEGTNALAPLPAERLSALLATAAPRLRALVLLCCYSAAAISALRNAAAFVVTAAGTLSDEGAVDFAGIFHEEFLKSGNVPQAFRLAQWYARRGLRDASAIAMHLTRRAERLPGGTLVCTPMTDREIVFDLASIEAHFAEAHEARRFASQLSDRLRGHAWLFQQQRERALIVLGGYCAEFAWTTLDDAIRCLRIRRIDSSLSPEVLASWLRLLYRYHDLTWNRYRRDPAPASENMRPHLDRALQDVQAYLTDGLDASREPALAYAPREQLTLTQANVRASADLAASALDRDALDTVVRMLESAITSIHDLVDALSDCCSTPIVASPH